MPLMSPSLWISKMLTAHAPHHGRAIDLACGSGRHTQLLRAHGLSVLAVDHNPERETLADCEGVQFQCLDLEGPVWPLADVYADVVVVSNYLYRPRLAEIFALLEPGGILIYETFGVGNEAYGRPARAEFLLADGELAERAPRDCMLLESSFGLVETPKPAIRARACFQRQMPD